MRAVLRDPLLRSLAGATPLAAFGIGMFFATYMIFVTRGLGFHPGVLGVIFGLGGISSLFGAVLAGGAARRFGVGPVDDRRRRDDGHLDAVHPDRAGRDGRSRPGC